MTLKKIHCILCNGSVAYEGDATRFNDHLRMDHEVTQGFEWVLGGSLLDPWKRETILRAIPNENVIQDVNNDILGDLDADDNNAIEEENKAAAQTSNDKLKVVLSIDISDDEEGNNIEHSVDTACSASDITNANKDLINEVVTVEETSKQETRSYESKTVIECNFCDHTSRSKFDLTKHMENVHSMRSSNADYGTKPKEKSSESRNQSLLQKEMEDFTNLLAEQSSSLNVTVKNKTKAAIKTYSAKVQRKSPSKCDTYNRVTDETKSKLKRKHTENDNKDASIIDVIGKSKSKPKRRKTNHIEPESKDNSKEFVEPFNTEQLLAEKSLDHSEDQVPINRKLKPKNVSEQLLTNIKVKLEKLDDPTPADSSNEAIKSDSLNELKEGNIEKESSEKHGSTFEKEDTEPNNSNATQDNNDNEKLLVETNQDKFKRKSKQQNAENALNIEKKDVSNYSGSSDKQAEIKVNDTVQVMTEVKIQPKDFDEPKLENTDSESLTEEFNKIGHDVDISGSEYFQFHSSMICQLTSARLKEFDMSTVFKDPNLPANWFYITYGKRRDLCFITPDRKLIRSKTGVIEYMKISKLYSEEEIETCSKNIQNIKTARVRSYAAKEESN